VKSGGSRSAYNFFHLPPAPFHLSSGSVLRVLLGIGSGLRFTTYSLHPLKVLSLGAWLVKSLGRKVT